MGSVTKERPPPRPRRSARSLGFSVLSSSRLINQHGYWLRIGAPVRTGHRVNRALLLAAAGAPGALPISSLSILRESPGPLAHPGATGEQRARPGVLMLARTTEHPIKDRRADINVLVRDNCISRGAHTFRLPLDRNALPAKPLFSDLFSFRTRALLLQWSAWTIRHLFANRSAVEERESLQPRRKIYFINHNGPASQINYNEIYTGPGLAPLAALTGFSHGFSHFPRPRRAHTAFDAEHEARKAARSA